MPFGTPTLQTTKLSTRMSIPMPYPSPSPRAEANPRWHSAALRGLYPSRTEYTSAETATRTKATEACRWKRLFRRHSAVTRAHVLRESMKSTYTSSKNLGNDQRINPTLAETPQRRDSVVGSTCATIMTSSISSPSSGCSTKDELAGGENDFMSGAIMRTCSSEISELQLPLRVANITMKDHSINMGMAALNEEGAGAIPPSALLGNESREEMNYKPPNSHYSKGDERVHYRTPESGTGLSAKFTVNSSRGTALAVVSEARSPRDAATLAELIPLPPSQVPLQQSTSRSGYRTQTFIVENSAQQNCHSHVPKRETMPPQHSQGTETNRAKRISLSALRRLPQRNSKRSSSTTGKDKTTKVEENKLEYYFDTERGVMIRSGLYNKNHRLREAHGNGSDLFRRIREAGIWQKLAKLVLW